MRRVRAVVRASALAVALVLGTTGCGLTHLQDLNFRVDDRLDFTAPDDRALVRQPFVVSWTIDDFTIRPEGSAPPSRDAGYFAVFVDQQPIKPGETMKAVAKDDHFCANDPSCPDRAYLHEHEVYVTTDTSLRLAHLTNLLGVKDDIQLHTITVVLMDTAGHRIGESAWELDVRMHKVGI